MKKLFSLIKTSLNHDMNIFAINCKKKSKFLKNILPLILTLYILFIMGTYSKMLIHALEPMHLEFIALTLFALGVSIFTFMEGIYKSGNLLFNCKDDNLLLSLPIKKETILFVRVLKFYVFELLFNTMFILPSMVMYAIVVSPGWTYYLVSIIALLILPIVPIVLSCFLGFILIFISSKFKRKNIFQTIFTMAFLLLFLFIYYNADGFMTSILERATSVNNFIVRLYYPVGTYISLINDFKVLNLLIYILIHLGLFTLTLFFVGKIYFKINSNSKRVLTPHKKQHYVIKRHSKAISFMKKELNRFFCTPVFITNAGFGLVLFIIACIIISIKFDSLLLTLTTSEMNLDANLILKQLPALMFGVVCFGSLMTSISSSMISLEGKSFNILKSLPLKPIKIIGYKILTTFVIIIPCIIIGDIIIFIKFKFALLSIVLILVASVLIPVVTELIGIIVNLRYPKMDATNDTEIVKQSISSMISTFIGIGLFGITMFLIIYFINHNINSNLIVLLFIGVYSLICLILWLILYKTCDKSFNNITV